MRRNSKGRACKPALLHHDEENGVFVMTEMETREEGESALMLPSLLDMLLIPRQEYQQYLTGNVTECQAGKCHWGRTGG